MLYISQPSTLVCVISIITCSMKIVETQICEVCEIWHSKKHAWKLSSSSSFVLQPYFSDDTSSSSLDFKYYHKTFLVILLLALRENETAWCQKSFKYSELPALICDIASLLWPFSSYVLCLICQIFTTKPIIIDFLLAQAHKDPITCILSKIGKHSALGFPFLDN